MKAPYDIILTVTNDLNYDQRMHRICGSLSRAGFKVLLLGRLKRNSKPLSEKEFQQKRINCYFEKGPLFYLIYNIRIFFFLLFNRSRAVCSCDLDSLLSGGLICIISKRKLIYDAHEYFIETPEVHRRRIVKFIWKSIGNLWIKTAELRYTVNNSLSEKLEEVYGARFEVVRNVPLRVNKKLEKKITKEKTILYQGVLNEGRGLEVAIKSMSSLKGFKLLLAGEGDLSSDLKGMVDSLGLKDRVEFLGMLNRKDLIDIHSKTWIGLNLLEAKSLNYYYSSANKFFDYIQSGIPQIGMNFPEYALHNKTHQLAVLINEINTESLIEAINRLHSDNELYSHIQSNCHKAAQIFTWENEEEKLIELYQDLLN